MPERQAVTRSVAAGVVHGSMGRGVRRDMWISKKRWKRLAKGVADLEKTQSQQSIEEAQKRFDELIQKYLDNPNRLKF